MGRSGSRGSGGGLATFALILGLFMMAGAGAAYYVGPRLLAANQTPPATLSTPQEVAGLTLSDDPQLATQATQVRTELAAEESDATDTMAAVYADPQDASKLVLVAAAALSVSSPKDKLDAIFTGQASAQIKLEARKDVSTGSSEGRGGCAAGTAQGSALVVCVWADPDSAGVIYFFNRPAPSPRHCFQRSKMPSSAPPNRPHYLRGAGVLTKRRKLRSA